MRYCEIGDGQSFEDSAAFHEYSISRNSEFWQHFLLWSGIVFEGSPETVRTDDRCEFATFFPDLKLSYVENLLLGQDLAYLCDSCYARYMAGEAIAPRRQTAGTRIS